MLGETHVVWKVILIGDSIRMGYEPLVREMLTGTAEVWGPDGNGGDSRNVLAHIDAWAVEREADVVHFNCGLHDLKVLADGSHQVPVDEYVRNLRDIIGRLRGGTTARLIWATSTPVHDERHRARPGSEFTRLQKDVETYSRKALEVVNAAGLVVNDLHDVIERAGLAGCLSPDGVHMTERGNRLLAETVASIVAPHVV